MLVDLIVENGRIHTGDPQEPVVDSLAVLDGRVAATGHEVDGLKGRRRVNAHHRVVLPGFNDAHAHSVWFGTPLFETDLSRVGSLDDVYRTIEERAQSAAPDEGTIACGYNPVLLHGAVPDRDVLVRVSGGRPVWIKHASGHSCQVNGEGMRRAVGPDRSAWSHRGRSLLDAGLPLGFSSDRPVAPGAPLAGIQAFVERISEEGLSCGPDERLTVEEAVRAATEGSSQTGLDALRGVPRQRPRPLTTRSELSRCPGRRPGGRGTG
ncbi:amidohydrolase family protein [Streptomyces sp. NPDC001443]